MKNNKFLTVLLLITMFGFSIGLKLSTAFYHLTYQTEKILFKSGYWQNFPIETLLKKGNLYLSNKELIKEQNLDEKAINNATSKYQKYKIEKITEPVYLSFEYKFVNLSENNLHEEISNESDFFVKINNKVVRQISQHKNNTEVFDRIFILLDGSFESNENLENILEFSSNLDFEIKNVTTTKWLVNSGNILIFKTKNSKIELANTKQTFDVLSQIFEYQIKDDFANFLIENKFSFRGLNPSGVEGEMQNSEMVFESNLQNETLKFETFFRDNEFTIIFENLPNEVVSVDTFLEENSTNGQKIALEKILHHENEAELPVKYSKNKKQFFSFVLPENINKDENKLKVILTTESQKNSYYFVDISLD